MFIKSKYIEGYDKFIRMVNEDKTLPIKEKDVMYHEDKMYDIVLDIINNNKDKDHLNFLYNLTDNDILDISIFKDIEYYIEYDTIKNDNIKFQLFYNTDEINSKSFKHG